MSLLDNLLLCLECDEGSGLTAADSSGNGHDGALQNGAAWGAGKVGSGALSFDGVNDQVALGTALGIDNVAQLTFAAWVNVTTLVNFSMILSHSNAVSSSRLEVGLGGGGLGGNDDIFVGIGSANTGYTSGNFISTGAWKHVCCVYDGTQGTAANRVVLYIDGVARSLTLAGTWPTTLNNIPTENTYLGRRGVANSLPLAGLIDQPAIWLRALSAAEVASLYNSGAGLPFLNFAPVRAYPPLDLGMGIDSAFFLN